MITSALTGLVLSLAAMLCCAGMIKNEIVPAGEWGMMSKAALCVGAVGACVYTHLRIKRNRFLYSLLGNLMMTTVLAMISLMFKQCQFSLWGMILDLAIIVAASFLSCTIGNKQGKGRKHR